MHNVRKDSRLPESEAQREEKLKKISKYVKLSSTVLALHKEGKWNEQGFDICGKLIELNPDFYTLWNYRRKALEGLFASSGTDDKASLCVKELDLTERALKRNPKSYCAWHQRLWIIDCGTSDLDREIALCGAYLASDPRNFHCWDYRGQIVRRLPESRRKEVVRREFDFTTAKINENFSNYSAWHYRSVFLPQLGTENESEFVDKEFELVRQAFFTQPEDQSAWLYHRWLVSRCGAAAGLATERGSGSAVSLPASPGMQGLFPALTIQPPLEDAKGLSEDACSHFLDVLVREFKSCKELLEIEPNCTMALLTSASLLHTLHAIAIAAVASHVQPVNAALAKNGMAASLAQSATLEVSRILTQLAELDPLRKRFYTDMALRHSMS